MKTIPALAASTLLAATMAVTATPAPAQNLSFGWSFGPGYLSYDQDYRPWWRAAPRVRSGITIGIDGVDVRFRTSRSWRSHVERCEDRYRSYDEDTDQYLGFDGEYHYCRL
jgi:hypothetical protein